MHETNHQNSKKLNEFDIISLKEKSSRTRKTDKRIWIWRIKLEKQEERIWTIPSMIETSKRKPSQFTYINPRKKCDGDLPHVQWRAKRTKKEKEKENIQE